MATSGSVSSSRGSDSYFRVDWTRTAVSSAENKSTIAWQLYAVCNNQWGVNAVRINSVTINGTVVQGQKSYSNISYETRLLESGTLDIQHDANGNKEFTIAIAGWFYVGGNVSGSKIFQLDSIPQTAAVSISYESATETTVTINWQADATIDYLEYSFNGGTSWINAGAVDATFGAYTIAGLTQNADFQVALRARRKDSQLKSVSNIIPAHTFNYPHAESMPDFTIGDSFAIGLYNPLGREVAITLKAADNSTQYFGQTSGTGIVGMNDPTWQTFWYESIPSSMSGQYYVQVTYQSHVETWAGGVYTVNGGAAHPTIGTLSYQDTNATVTAITGNNQKIVRNLSTVRFSAANCVATSGATLAGVSLSVYGQTTAMTLSGSTATASNITIDSGRNVRATITATDSRGVTTSKTITVTMLDWYNPTAAIISLRRQDGYYDTTTIMVDAQYAGVGGSYAVTITYKARVAGTSSWTIAGNLSDGVAGTFTADATKEWDVQVIIADSFGGTTTYNLTLSRGTPLVFYDIKNSAVGVNGFPTSDNKFEVYGKSRFHNNVHGDASGFFDGVVSSDAGKTSPADGLAGTILETLGVDIQGSAAEAGQGNYPRIRFYGSAGAQSETASINEFADGHIQINDVMTILRQGPARSNGLPSYLVSIPYYDATDVSWSGDNGMVDGFLTAWCKKVMSAAAFSDNTLYVGSCANGSKAIIMLFVYSDVLINDMPQYSTGLVIPYVSSVPAKRFGTNAGVFWSTGMSGNGMGTALASGDNVDSLPVNSRYYSASSSVSAVLSGTPPTTSSGFTIVTSAGYTSARRWQYAYGNGVNDVWRRFSSNSGSTWSSWTQDGGGGGTYVNGDDVSY